MLYHVQKNSSAPIKVFTSELRAQAQYNLYSQEAFTKFVERVEGYYQTDDSGNISPHPDMLPVLVSVPTPKRNTQNNTSKALQRPAKPAKVANIRS